MKFGRIKGYQGGRVPHHRHARGGGRLKGDGHEVYVQRGAGARRRVRGRGSTRPGGRQLVDTMEEIYGTCDFVTKVKEFEPCEFGLLRENQIVFTCIHPAAHPEEVQALLDSKCIAFTAEDAHRYGSPNCEAAGKRGALMGLESLLSINGGKGKFVSGLGGAPGVKALVHRRRHRGPGLCVRAPRPGGLGDGHGYQHRHAAGHRQAVQRGGQHGRSPTAIISRSFCRRSTWFTTACAGRRMPRSL